MDALNSSFSGLAGSMQDEQALQAYGQALSRGVQAPEEVHLNRSVIFTDVLRRDDEAERELQAALACRPGYAPALLNLGNLHEERGQREAAMACYRALVSPAGGRGLLQRFDLRDPELDRRCEALARLVQLAAPETVDDPLLVAVDNPASVPVRSVSISGKLEREKVRRRKREK